MQGAQIGDNALCGGGDPNQGITSTSPLISSAASAAIKAVIWAGNPRNSPAESSFRVGSCTAGGVSRVTASYKCKKYLMIRDSSILDQTGSLAPRIRPRFVRTVMPLVSKHVP